MKVNKTSFVFIFIISILYLFLLPTALSFAQFSPMVIGNTKFSSATTWMIMALLNSLAISIPITLSAMWYFLGKHSPKIAWLVATLPLLIGAFLLTIDQWLH